MVARCAVNKGACFLTFSLALLTILLFNNLTSSNSADFATGSSIADPTSYGIIIDAGSTGSRLFLYSWTSNSPDELINIRSVNDDAGKPVVKKVSPGLSTFSDHPDASPDYIKPLLDYASQFVPENKRSATPVFIFATAGMRLLPIEKQENIMRNLREKLPKLTKLQVLSQHIQVISGKWEGIYSWTAINYMLGRFNLTSSSKTVHDENSGEDSDKKMLAASSSAESKVDRPKSAGMIDMGGASAQIAFEIPSVENGDENAQVINLGCRDEDPRFLYRLFVTTFLGFGVNEGAKKYETLLWRKLSNESDNAQNHSLPVPYVLDGCLPADMLKLAYIEDAGSQFVRKGNGDWDTCVDNIASLLFDGDSKCTQSTKSCFFGGIQAPPGVSLSKVELYGFSEYWFSVEDVLSLGGHYEHNKFEEKAKEFCHQSWKTIKKKMQSRFYPKADSERLETQCFKSAWIHAILHNGFRVDEMHHHFQSAFRINGQEVQWALGAMIYQMRYFPLLKESQQHSVDLNRIHQQLHGGSLPGWSLFYLVCIAAVLFLLWRMWLNSRQQTPIGSRRNGSSSSPRYWRLGEQTPNPQLPI